MVSLVPMRPARTQPTGRAASALPSAAEVGLQDPAAGERQRAAGPRYRAVLQREGDTVRDTRRGRLLRLLRWPRGNSDGPPGEAGSGGPDGADAGEGQRQALDWRAAQERLGPIRHRWDLAILCNLDEVTGSRPADLLAAINSQARSGRQLSPQVLSGRLRGLEQDGYVRHEDHSVMPLHRFYYLQPPGLELISDLARIIRPERSAHGAASASRQPSVAGR